MFINDFNLLINLIVIVIIVTVIISLFMNLIMDLFYPLIILGKFDYGPFLLSNHISGKCVDGFDFSMVQV
jgi:hypothetical protein